MSTRPRATHVVDMQSIGEGKTQKGRRTDPWEVITRFLADHSYAEVKTRWMDSSKIAVSYGKSRAVFDVSVHRFFTGDIRSLDMRTTTIRPKATDPPGSYNVALSMSFDRGTAANDRECQAEIHIVSKKPTHGVLSGTDALGIGVAIARHVGCETVKLTDASSLHCDGAKDGEVALRRARILSRGSGWYESNGFRSVIETLHPGRFRSTVGRLHTLRIGTLMSAMTKLDAMLRPAIVDRALMSQMKLAKYDMREEAAQSVPMSLSGVMSVVSTVSVALEIITQALENMSGAKPTTLGALVDRLLKDDCGKASALVQALLPSTDEYFVMTHGPQGRPAPPLPLQDAWVFAWRVTNTYSDLTLRIT